MVEQERTTIPAQVVVLLRGALYTELTRACEDMPDTMPETHERTGWADVLARLDGARGALDVIGWEAPAEQQDVTVVLGMAMIEALEAERGPVGLALASGEDRICGGARAGASQGRHDRTVPSHRHRALVGVEDGEA